ncbi:MAG TPA: hypothetical protein VF762_23480 [Blastocatellia bacterium]|jgi:hypothetical protein
MRSGIKRIALLLATAALLAMPLHQVTAATPAPNLRAVSIRTVVFTFDSKNFQQPFTSAARTATATSSTFTVGNVDNLVGYESVTAASGTTPTLDVKVQDTPDGGTLWFDIAGMTHTQATGATTEVKSATRKFATKIRVVATIAGTTPSFTFSYTILSY